jgi:hypothetical protein
MKASGNDRVEKQSTVKAKEEINTIQSEVSESRADMQRLLGKNKM